jgi:small ligand-binding sensory domain FIST
MFVTRRQGNVIFGLDGRTPLEVLQGIYAGLDRRDQERFRHSLFVGLVMREKSEVYRQGDFLIRNIVGLDAERGTLAVGAYGARHCPQFPHRDAATGGRPRGDPLSAAPEQRGATRGSLLFSCLGRGRHLYGRADHDTTPFRRHLGRAASAVFSATERSDVHGTTFLHGYTSFFEAVSVPRTAQIAEEASGDRLPATAFR